MQNTIRNELSNIEARIYDLEGIYLQETGTFGNIIKGWDSFIGLKNHRNNSLNTVRKNKVLDKDRLFSLSSLTSDVNGKLRNDVDQVSVEASSHNVNTNWKKRKIKKPKHMMNQQKGYVRPRDQEEDNYSESAKSPVRKRSMASKGNKKTGNSSKNGVKKSRGNNKTKRTKKKKD